MSLDQVVSISISTASATVSRAGFGTPMLLSNEATGLAAFASPTYAKSYTDASQMITDGFSSSGVAYAKVRKIFSQNPKPQSVVVAKRATRSTQIIKLTPVASNSTKYSLIINGTTVDFTSDGSATIEEIIDGFVTNITAAALGVTPTKTDTNGKLTLTGTLGVPFTCKVVNRAQFTYQDVTADPGIAADLTAIGNNSTLDWYCALLDTQGINEIKALAAAVEAMRKIYIATTGDSDVLTSSSSDVASQLQTAAYARTAVIFHPDQSQHADAGWAGNCLPLEPGSETWKFKTLASVDVYTLTPTERAYAVAKGCNVYERVAGNNMTAEGTVAEGEFIDVIRFIDFIAARTQENVFSRMKALPKVAFTDSGIAIIESEVRGVMKLGISSGGFASDPEPQVTVPAAADVADADKSARLLPDVRFSATLAGAIHATQITGTVTV